MQTPRASTRRWPDQHHAATLSFCPSPLPCSRVQDQNPEGKYEALAKYGRDLTQAAREGKLDPVIGRWGRRGRGRGRARAARLACA